MHEHLFILLHGWHGSQRDMHYIRKQIKANIPNSYCIRITNEHKTGDGIDSGGERAADQVEDTVARMRDVYGSDFQKLYVIGHSLGGLYGRYMLGVLHQRKALQDLEWVSYVTLASPHMGSRQHIKVTSRQWLDSTVAFFSGPTGEHLYLVDGIDMFNNKKTRPGSMHRLRNSVSITSSRKKSKSGRKMSRTKAARDMYKSRGSCPARLDPRRFQAAAFRDHTGSDDDESGEGSDSKRKHIGDFFAKDRWGSHAFEDDYEPLLVRLCKSPFIDALARFQHRTAYANINHDFFVGICTASMTPVNVYKGRCVGFIGRACLQ